MRAVRPPNAKGRNKHQSGEGRIEQKVVNSATDEAIGIAAACHSPLDHGKPIAESRAEALSPPIISVERR